MRTAALLAACLSLVNIINGYGFSIAMMENIGTVPDGWRMVGVPDPSQRLRFRIAVKQGYKALTDIVDGGSTGCMLNELGEPETPYVSGASWNATVGWDPVTGWGKPDFGKMLKLAMRREERRPWRWG
ncbi:Tripeptidyl-peptidase sed2 [Coniosporium apollinis]|uniref:Tripeptidyl-peptidase sed2 n=2 Tax=Coniosporium TaxID=2810619 RepID=A0ABQ9NK01_9PEZI|nr:Tripeptidyl-peptidase sed2 [Cladosporium sp. JES 115]KAJ9657959.1 Tripeptidyl-peptidase sed2 [Coniosporium apollinis]